MATVTLTFTDVWLTDVANPAMSVHGSFSERKSDDEVAGDVRPYAGGRLRSITSARTKATYPIVVQLLSDSDAALLKAWRGRVLLLRDSAGRRVFGTYFARSVEDFPMTSGTLHNVSLTFQEITYFEAV